MEDDWNGDGDGKSESTAESFKEVEDDDTDPSCSFSSLLFTIIPSLRLKTRSGVGP